MQISRRIYKNKERQASSRIPTFLSLPLLVKSNALREKKSHSDSDAKRRKDKAIGKQQRGEGKADVVLETKQSIGERWGQNYGAGALDGFWSVRRDGIDASFHLFCSVGSTSPFWLKNSWSLARPVGVFRFRILQAGFSFFGFQFFGGVPDACSVLLVFIFLAHPEGGLGCESRRGRVSTFDLLLSLYIYLWSDRFLRVHGWKLLKNDPLCDAHLIYLSKIVLYSVRT